MDGHSNATKNATTIRHGPRIRLFDLPPVGISFCDRLVLPSSSLHIINRLRLFQVNERPKEVWWRRKKFGGDEVSLAATK